MRFRGQRLLPSPLRRRGLPLALANLELDDAAALVGLDDLFYRLSVAYFLSEFCARNNFRMRAVDPDERMAILTTGDCITVEAIPLELRLGPSSRPAAGLQQVRDLAERDRIRQALEETEWNVAAAARRLGTERTALHKRMRALGPRRT